MSPLENTASLKKTQTVKIPAQGRKTSSTGQGAVGNWRQYRPLPDGPDSDSVPGCTLEGILGRGGMGTVYLARQDVLDRLVAVKVLNNTAAEGSALTERLKKEAFIMGAMNHPNLVGCHDIVPSAKGTCIIMEYIPGHINGRNALRLLGEMPEHYVVKTLLGITRGLAYASEKGYTHRDVKPDNLLFFFSQDRPPKDYDELFLLPDSRVALCDFGIANLAEEIRKEADNNDDNSENVSVTGSPLYMAPEQAVKPESVDCRSDIYSLAATAYFLLTGQPPFNGADWHSIIEKKVDNDIPPVRHKKVRISGEFATVLAKMGARHPDNRYQDYYTLIADLEEVELLHADRAQSIRRFIYGHQKAFILGSTVILTLLILALLGSHLYTAYLLDMNKLRPWENLQLHSWSGDMSEWRHKVEDGTVSILGNHLSQPLTLRKNILPGDIFYCRLKIVGNGKVTFELRQKGSAGVAQGHFTCLRDGERYRMRMFSSTMDKNSAMSGSVPMPENFPDAAAHAVSIKITLGENHYTVSNQGIILGVGHFQTDKTGGAPMELTLKPTGCDAIVINEMQIIHRK